MKKRGRYVILTGKCSTRSFGGPSWVNDGRGPTLKEMFSNELYLSPGLENTPDSILTYIQYFGRSTNFFNCDFGDDSDSDIFGDHSIGVPFKDLKSWLHEKLSPYACDPIQFHSENHYYPFIESWSSYETLNFKKFLMSRGFDVDILDWNDIEAVCPNHSRAPESFRDCYEAATGHSKYDVEYVLIVNANANYFQMLNGPMWDNAVAYGGNVSDSHHWESDKFSGTDWMDEDSHSDLDYGFIESDAGNFGFPIASVGRWSIPQIGQAQSGWDIVWKIINTIEFHTNEAQKHVYYNPHLQDSSHFQYMLTDYCTRSACNNYPYNPDFGQSCTDNGYKVKTAEPGYQYERLMGVFNNDLIIQTCSNSEQDPPPGDDRATSMKHNYDYNKLSSQKGMDFEPPVSRNPEFARRYKLGVNREEYIQLLKDTDEWEQLNPSEFESFNENSDICDEGFYWDIVTEQCEVILSSNTRPGPFYSPLNAVNWLRRKWDDLGYYTFMYGPPADNQIIIPEHFITGTAYFQYRGNGEMYGPSHPEMKWEGTGEWPGSNMTEWTNSLNLHYNPMVGLAFVCDCCDMGRDVMYADHCFCDHFQTPSMYLDGGINYRRPRSGVFIAWIGASELHTEAKFNNYLLGNFWRYMFGEVSKEFIDKRANIRNWENLRNQEIGYALDQAKYGLQSEPNIDQMDNINYNCESDDLGPTSCYERYWKIYNILGDPSVAFYIGKPKKIYIEQNNEPTNLALREGITLDDLNFTLSLGSGHGGVRLDEAVGVVLYNGGSDVDEDWITLTKSYSNDNGIMEFNIPDDLPAGEVELFIQINRYQHWPVNFRVYYNS